MQRVVPTTTTTTTTTTTWRRRPRTLGSISILVLVAVITIIACDRNWSIVSSGSNVRIISLDSDTCRETNTIKLKENTKNQIPKILHQTWKSSALTERFERNARMWRKVLPDYEYRFYNDSMIFKWFDEHFPTYAEFTRTIRNGGALADIFRYAVLYIEGGVYVDIDTVPHRRFPDYMLRKKLVIGLEFDPVSYPHEKLQLNEK